MRLFIKKYLTGKWGIAEEVSDNMILKCGNDEKGSFDWIEVKIIKPPAMAQGATGRG